MNLQTYLDNQAEIQKLLNHPMGQNDVAIKENILALIVEATEVLNEVNWKPWRITQRLSDKYALVAELADLFHFFCNILNEAGITAEDFDKAWLSSNEKIMERINNGY